MAARTLSLFRRATLHLTPCRSRSTKSSRCAAGWQSTPCRTSSRTANTRGPFGLRLPSTALRRPQPSAGGMPTRLRRGRRVPGQRCVSSSHGSFVALPKAAEGCRTPQPSVCAQSTPSRGTIFSRVSGDAGTVFSGPRFGSRRCREPDRWRRGSRRHRDPRGLRGSSRRRRRGSWRRGRGWPFPRD